MIKITPKPKNMIDKNPWNPNYDQNTPETSKITEIEVSGYFGCFEDIFDKLKVLRVFQSF